MSLGAEPEPEPEARPRSGALSARWACRYAARTLATNLVWPLVLLGTVPTALSARSLSAWWWSAAVCLLFAGAFLLFGTPPRCMLLRVVRPGCAAGVIVVVGSAAIRASQLRGSLDVADAIPLLLGAGLLAVRLADARRALRESTAPLLWPLPGGRWTVVEGTGTLPNHHWSTVAQRGALDLVGRVRGGRSTARLLPRNCADFAAYGHEVLAPCDGVVRSARDGHPDRPDPRSPPPGNHVVIAADGGEEITLAHLASGSTTVSPGRTVARGETVGRVGNSGNSTEPHLHIHAVRDGRPLRPRFADVRGSLRRNAVVAVR